MRYTVRKSIVRIIGNLWMPQCPAATQVEVTSYDLENMRDDDGKLTRDSVEQWVMTHSGDFSSVTDFYASLEDGEATVEIPWSSEENELAWGDAMHPAED